MRILHTSDWHLGRNFHGTQLLDAQVSVLDALVEMVESERIDVVVVAGDIFDRSVPSADAVEALSHVLGELRGKGATVVGISGNHDSAERVGFAESVMARGGVALRGDISRCSVPVVVPQPDGKGAVAFYPIPYLDVDRARHALDLPDVRTHGRLLSAALDRARADLASKSGIRSVAIVHAFVSGGTSCDSELALSVGGSAEVPMSCLSGFDYVALGHLHARQSLGGGGIRYSGSPLPYSFSERTHVKGAWLLDIPSIGDLTVTPVDLPVHRRLHVLRGDLDTLLRDPLHLPAEAGYVHAVLTDHVLPLHAMARLRERFAHISLVSHEPPVNDIVSLSYRERIRGRSDHELACDFVAHVTGRHATEDEASDLAEAICAAARDDGPDHQSGRAVA